MFYNISLGVAKKLLFFIKKKLFNAGTGMGEIPEPVETGMEFNFSSPLGMGTSKYMRIGYEDGECKTRLHPAPLPCLLIVLYLCSGSGNSVLSWP